MSKEKAKQRKQRVFKVEDIDSFVTSVKEIPKSEKLRHSILYDGIIDRILADKSKGSFKIEVPDMTFKQLYAPMDSRIQKRKAPLKIIISNKILYLKKFNTYEEVQALRKIHKKKIKKPE
jgi:hypothetical protein